MLSILNKEAKEAIIKKVFNKEESQSMEVIARGNNVKPATLRKWVQRAKLKTGCQRGSIPSSVRGSSVVALSSAERLEHLLAAAKLNEVELGAYCRERGLYSFQFEQWKKEFGMQANDPVKEQDNAELKALRLENKILKSDLIRKDKALAEASALLILKKKANLIWGDPEDDCSTLHNENKR